MKVKEIKCKSALSISKIPGQGYVINPYFGCQHGCQYCYAKVYTFGHEYEKEKDLLRFIRTQLELDWRTPILKTLNKILEKYEKD